MTERPRLPSGPGSTPTLARYAIYNGRYGRQVRLATLALITVVIATTRPSPGVHGHGLVILITLVVTVAAHLAALAVPARAVTARIFTELLAGAVLAGFDPGSSAVLLAFAGLDAATFLPLGRGVYAIALAVVSEALATLAASNEATDALFGLGAVAGFLLGTTIRQYELRAEEAELRFADAERAEQERARAVQLAERANAAREIHDILAHNLGALVMQLNAANAILESAHPDLDSVRPLLRDAHRHAADGLKEARQAVSSLREQTATPVEVSLHELVGTNPSASLEISGTPRPVPAEVATVMRRAAQEALTNATKHAPGAQPVVRVDFGPSSIMLTVTDAGSPPNAQPSVLAGTGGGYGLAGMRERAELVGAHLTAGPKNGGWQVQLTITDIALR
jgi:signal transduction histidine kinase